MTEFFNLGLAPKVRLPSDSENDREGLTGTLYSIKFKFIKDKHTKQKCSDDTCKNIMVNVITVGLE